MFVKGEDRSCNSFHFTDEKMDLDKWGYKGELSINNKELKWTIKETVFPTSTGK